MWWRKQDIAICVFIAVTIVEAFLNAYFRRLTLDAQFAQHTERLPLELRQKLGFPVVATPIRSGGIEQGLLRHVRSPLNDVTSWPLRRDWTSC